MAFWVKPTPAWRLKTCTAGMVSAKPRITYGAASSAARACRTPSVSRKLEAENARLNKLLDEQMFENDVIKEVLQKRP